MSIWRWPIASAAASIVALTAGLILEGWGDAIAWAGLGLPVFQCAWYWLLRRRPVGSAACGLRQEPVSSLAGNDV